ncbi:hypothetical protein [Streptomyces erythrochromogenes]|uniref:hypothetical protein n=1 Tax=Streptomyces erythrochromogenes TaxID=285574 RepID=UPI003865C043|nr:hypothetical protein OG364_29570 [Streptomyces erythrochromogenes]
MDPLARTGADHLAAVLRLSFPEAIAAYHRMLGVRLRHATLPGPLVDGLRWLHQEDQESALRVAAAVLTEVGAQRNGPPVDYAARALALSLHITDDGWTEADADAFVAAALNTA